VPDADWHVIRAVFVNDELIGGDLSRLRAPRACLYQESHFVTDAEAVSGRCGFLPGRDALSRP